MNDLQAKAQQLGGDIAAGGVVCPGPGHSQHDRSLSVTFSPDAPGGFVVYSFAGDDPIDCRDHVKRLLGMEAWRPGGGGEPGDQKLARPRSHIQPSICAPEASDNGARALEIWRESRSITGTIAEKYLRQRIGNDSFAAWPADLRFHHRCPRGNQQRLPALVALSRDIRTDAPRAIQRIFLKDDGSDRLRDQMGKATLGSAAGAVCKLSPDDAVTHGLGLAEGVEKALALIAAGWSPIWATCGTSGLTAFPVLSGIETLTIFADADEPGQRAARTCAERWAAAGRDVTIRTPKEDGRDFDEILKVAP